MELLPHLPGLRSQLTREVPAAFASDNPRHRRIALVGNHLPRRCGIANFTTQPIHSAADEDREGYVPNVVYSCGAMRAGDDIFLPYGVADSSVAFAFVAIGDLLGAM